MRPWIALLAALGAACAPALAEPVTALEAGRLPEAAAAFRALEPRVAALSPGERTRYALYRGLTYLALGDAVQAERWLSRAKRAVERDPSLLAPAERGRLLAARRSMGRMPGE